MNKPKFQRWLIFITVFVALVVFWGTLAAAAPHTTVQAATPTPIEGMIEPVNASSTIILGAILMLAIIVTGTVIRKLNRG